MKTTGKTKRKMTNMPEHALFKILDQNMQSCNGGTLTWKLNKWQTVTGPLEMCIRGLHLTKNPLEWYQTGRKIFVAEAEGIAERKDDKCVCRSVRLLAEVPQPLWDAYYKQVQTLRAAYGKQVQTLTDAYYKQVRPLRAAYGKQVQTLTDAYYKQVQPLRAAYDKQVQTLRDAYGKQVQPLRAAYDKQVQTLRAAYDKQVQTLTDELAQKT